MHIKTINKPSKRSSKTQKNAKKRWKTPLFDHFSIHFTHFHTQQPQNKNHSLINQSINNHQQTFNTLQAFNIITTPLHFNQSFNQSIATTLSSNEQQANHHSFNQSINHSINQSIQQPYQQSKHFQSIEPSIEPFNIHRIYSQWDHQSINMNPMGVGGPLGGQKNGKKGSKTVKKRQKWPKTPYISSNSPFFHVFYPKKKDI